MKLATFIAAFLSIPILGGFTPFASAQNDNALIANPYVRVSTISLPPAGTVSMPDNGHVHLLIADHPPLATVADPTAAQSAEFRSATVQLFEAGHDYRLRNDEKDSFSALWVELNINPGRVNCSDGKSCPWSIRGEDPHPIVLSEHVTVFKIAVPWKPEPHSLIIPMADVLIDGHRANKREPLWMDSPVEITGMDNGKNQSPSLAVLLAGSLPEIPSFIEMAFYDKPFCYCKRVRAAK